MEPLPIESRKLRFGTFEVDLETRELRRSGIRQKLGPQPFQLLQTMLERPGQLVTHEELRQRLWPNTAFVDHQLGLKKCINRIRGVLGDSADNPCYIETVPRRGYRFLAPVEQVTECDVNPVSPVYSAEQTKTPGTGERLAASPLVRRQRYKLLPVALSIAIVTITAALFFWKANNGNSAVPAGRQPEPVLLPLISLPGGQSMPAFSPDSSRVAFVWQAPRREESGIYEVVVGTQSLLRLTGSLADYSPAWSPDGRQIAFLADDRNNFRIEMVPALGGVPKTIYTGTRDPLSDFTGNVGLSFSPDRNLLAFSEWNGDIKESAIRVLSVQDSTAQFITSPPSGFRDLRPAFSPVGNQLAFVRSTGPAVVDDLFVVSAAGGRPRQLTFDHKRIFGPPAWSRNGEEIIFSSSRAGLEALWRIPVSGGVPQRIASTGHFAQYPSVSASSTELAYEHVDEEQNLWRVELNDRTHVRGPASILVPSANTYNLSPQFSADGRNLAFQSSRSGHAEVWISKGDGSNPAPATALPGFAGTPRWSPDGRYLAFDYRPHQHSEIHVVETNGVNAHSVAAFPDADAVIPSWSRDGRWVYFASDRGKTFQIWKTGFQNGAATTALPVQVTKNGGYVAFESTDGKQLFYTKAAQPGVWAMRLDEGSEHLVWSGPGPDYWSNWAVTKDGIYFMAPQADFRPQIQYLDFKTKRVSTLLKLEKPSFFGLAVAPDGRALVYSQWDRSEHDILVVKNFR